MFEELPIRKLIKDTDETVKRFGELADRLNALLDQFQQLLNKLEGKV